MGKQLMLGMDFGLPDGDLTVEMKMHREHSVLVVDEVRALPAAQRDDVLEALAVKRGEAVRAAIEIAKRLCAQYAEGITAADVQRGMKASHPELVEGLDQRYLGAVLLPSTGFERTGELRPTGSKARHQPCWRRAK